ncbi:MAG: hypothetical protein J2P45_21855 [Candidatus Dormibacteraeota bacterium]|nr:hypothetical protein [Candidatus Dormibacteraeota bacterium]
MPRLHGSLSAGDDLTDPFLAHQQESQALARSVAQQLEGAELSPPAAEHIARAIGAAVERWARSR